MDHSIEMDVCLCGDYSSPSVYLLSGRFIDFERIQIWALSGAFSEKSRPHLEYGLEDKFVQNF